MLRGFTFSLVSLTIAFSTACSQATTSPLITLTPTETVTVLATSTTLPYPMIASDSVLGSPYPYPAPNSTRQSAPTNSPLLTFTPLPPPSPIPPNIISRAKLNCTSQTDFAKCSDNTLHIEFDYPAVWGEIEAVLRTGDTGYAYDYTFSALTAEQASGILAGGRSQDFTEGRGGMITDFFGYSDSSSQSICASTKDFAAICEEVKPNVVLLMHFPEARYICDSAPGTLYSPIAIIEINLPGNPTINGFRFVAPFLSEQAAEKLNTDMRDILGYAPDAYPTLCGDASRVNFDNMINELVEGIKVGSVDSGTSENIARFEHIAQSVIFR